MDNVTKELKTNNMKLKGLVESVSSGSEACVCPCCFCTKMNVFCCMFGKQQRLHTALNTHCCECTILIVLNAQHTLL